ncbi:hypothetical protein SIID45300_02420 [Candidatus Magnetaquicoccaceae bacterium FCR-1]|uniref:ORC1/DEAH AAA+ ATPase domain-containing protein n=1 Tax=Candidatus Magnetaquiglobus chichijimensis TaxID=3141448 RepID=A0ABQ0CB26_9PROT
MESERITSVALLKNVMAVTEAMEHAMARPGHLPGLVCMHGFSGLGKSYSAIFVAAEHRAYFVQARSTWTRKAMLLAVLKEMGIEPERTIPEMVDQIAEQLAASRRPLIIDETDHLVERGLIEVVRDIHESAPGCTILLIGEEGLPGKLAKFERVHGRILDWVAAQPADMEDAKLLRSFYCKRVQVTDELLARIHRVSNGSARRICVNLERVQEMGASEGKREMDLAAWGDRAFYTGEAPTRRQGAR